MVGLDPNNPVGGAAEVEERPPKEANGDFVANSEAGFASGLTSSFGGAEMIHATAGLPNSYIELGRKHYGEHIQSVKHL